VTKPIELCTIHPIVYILCVLLLLFLCFHFFSCFSFFLRFCGHIFCKPSRDLTRPLRGTKWFKGLVAYAKCYRNSYECELGLQFSFLFLVLLEDEQKVGVGVFIRPLFDPILAHI